MVLNAPRLRTSKQSALSPRIAITGDLVTGRRQGKRIMAILRLATRVLGIGQKARIGRLGSASITAILAGLGVIIAAPAYGQSNADANGVLDSYAPGISLNGDAVAIGNNATAAGGYATAVGGYSMANGGYATATGFTAIANGGYATASGAFSTANGTFAFAGGYLANATGIGATAVGPGASA